MIKHNGPQDPSQKLALAISIFCHILLLLGAHYLPLRQWTTGALSISGYSITLHPVWNSQEQSLDNITHNARARALPTGTSKNKPAVPPSAKNKRVEKPAHSGAGREKIPQNAAPDTQTNTDITPTAEQLESSAQKVPETSIATNQERATAPKIDERGLYKTHQGKQTGALLELAGWMWDTAPHPQDNTDESGKIVFQITIDEFGEVIAIKTLEKTISPLVERIYKEALTQLTFSKTTNNTVYAPTFTGKVTFILQVN